MLLKRSDRCQISKTKSSRSNKESKLGEAYSTEDVLNMIPLTDLLPMDTRQLIINPFDRTEAQFSTGIVRFHMHRLQKLITHQ